MTYIRNIIFLSFLALLVACGGGSSSSSDENNDNGNSDFAVSTDSLSFNGVLGSISGQNITINSTGAEFSWRLEHDSNLLITPVQGTTGQSVEVNVNPAAAEGEYSTQITLSASVGSRTLSKVINVDLSVENRRIYVDKPGLAFSEVGSESNTRSEVNIYFSTDGDTGTTQVTTQSDWINAALTDSKVLVDVNGSGLPAGLHTGTIEVSNDAPGVNENTTIHVGFYKQENNAVEFKIRNTSPIRDIISDPVKPYVYVYTFVQPN